MSKKKDMYESAEVTFSKTNDLEVELYQFLLSQCRIKSKSQYLKELLLEKYDQEKGLSDSRRV